MHKLLVHYGSSQGWTLPDCARSFQLVHSCALKFTSSVQVGNYVRNLGVSILVHYHSVREVYSLCMQAFLAVSFAQSFPILMYMGKITMQIEYPFTRTTLASHHCIGP